MQIQIGSWQYPRSRQMQTMHLESKRRWNYILCPGFLFACVLSDFWLKKIPFLGTVYQYSLLVFYSSLRCIKPQKSCEQSWWSSAESVIDMSIASSLSKHFLGLFFFHQSPDHIKQEQIEKAETHSISFYKADCIYLFKWDRISVSSVFLIGRFKQIVQAASQAECAFLGTDSKTVSRHIKLSA